MVQQEASHSTIFILILELCGACHRAVHDFTFYYIYINTKAHSNNYSTGRSFTFYYIYINTLVELYELGV